MRVEIRHEFQGATREQLERLYLLDDSFNQAAFAAMGFVREVLARSRVGELFVRTLRLSPMRALPAPFSGLLSGATFHIIEQVRYDFDAHVGSWRTTPNLLSQHFDASGRLVIDQLPEGAAFRLEGAATSTLPLFAKRAEKQAVSTAERQHEELATAVRMRLAQLEPQKAAPQERLLS